MKVSILSRLTVTVLAVAVIAASFTACATNTNTPAPASSTPSQDTPSASAPVEALSGSIIIDGSSTVFPITEAITEEFRKTHPDVDIPIGISGTGGGFKKFVVGETDINDASRPIKDSERADAEANGIEFVEFMIAYDGLSVLVNTANDFVDSMTVEQLAQLWGPDSTVKNWSDLDPSWPSEPVKLYGAGTDSGTFDYFTEEINGKTGAIRTDFIPSEDDNVLVQGIAGDKNAMGFFGFAYYIENTDKLKAVKIDGGNGPVEPTFDTIKNGSYSPLSRPIYIYVNKESLAKPHVRAFVEYYLTDGTKLIPEVGYVQLDDALYVQELSKLN